MWWCGDGIVPAAPCGTAQTANAWSLPLRSNEWFLCSAVGWDERCKEWKIWKRPMSQSFVFLNIFAAWSCTQDMRRLIVYDRRTHVVDPDQICAESRCFKQFWMHSMAYGPFSVWMHSMASPQLFQGRHLSEGRSRKVLETTACPCQTVG